MVKCFMFACLAAIAPFVSCSDDDEGTSSSFKYTVNGTDSPTSLRVGVEAATTTVTVTATGSWSVASDATWLTLSGGSGEGNGSFDFIVSANAGAARTGVLTFTADGKQAGVLSITQTADDFSIDATAFSVEQDHRRAIIVTPPVNNPDAEFTFTSQSANASVDEYGVVTGDELGDATIIVSIADNSLPSKTVTVTVTRKLHFPLVLPVSDADGNINDTYSANVVSVLNEDGSYTLELIYNTEESNPASCIQTGNLGIRPLGDNVTKVELQFDYKADTESQFFRLTFLIDGYPTRHDAALPAVEDWTTKVIDITDVDNFGRSDQYHCLRLDWYFTPRPEFFHIRNLQVVIEVE